MPETTVPKTDLTGKVALITGASRGLGRAMALALGRDGAKVALVARDLEALNTVAGEIRATGGTAEVFPCDASQEYSVVTLADAVESKLGPVQVLINNAGVNLRKPITDFSLEEWNWVQSSNVTTVFLMCREFVPQMRRAGGGRIINMTSIMSHIALPERTAYASSKAALLGFTRALALELAPDGISVVGISPGPFATEMNQPLLEDPEKNAYFISRIPAGRWGKVEDIGALARFLCSEEAAFITGTDIVIDGGWCAQ